MEKEQENRAFEKMKKIAISWLEGKDPKDIEARTGISFETATSEFVLNSLGKIVRIRYPEYEMTPHINEWQQLVILHYMKLSDGSPLMNQLIAMSALKDGMVRGGDFDRRLETNIEKRFVHIERKDLEKKCFDLGGKIVKSNADFSVTFSFLPRYPVTLKIWFEDDEFPASGKLLFDASADHYLMIEDAVTVGQIIMEELISIF